MNSIPAQAPAARAWSGPLTTKAARKAQILGLRTIVLHASTVDAIDEAFSTVAERPAALLVNVGRVPGYVPLGLLAARHAAQARGEAGVIKQPTVFR